MILYSETTTGRGRGRGRPGLYPDPEKIHTAGKQLLALINEVLDFSKIEAGKMEVYPETFDVATMVQDVITTVEPLMEQKGNTLTVHCAADIGVHGFRPDQGG